ncbi:hypothetical protein [Corynebacterium glucuronolyticum]|uniref:Uncharacterized protein n=2 Tax=Corynebacterium glucuronolyticum TaxID=39791 RepID=A0AAX1L8J2_9CORY|nr:hypothetical protein [Corynebacterium glucuronolyticum]EEI61874.1 hypothetical protein HMPREF0293_2608 [Corynebacterium glucuronolyticum ATCC 51866]QRP70580.1 hypothetical protein I6J21_12740 [Corynebacterium glucuronolyticum]
MITDSTRAVLQEALNQRVSEGRMSLTECDHLSKLVWTTEDTTVFYSLWNNLATDTYPAYHTDLPLPGSPVLSGEPEKLHRTDQWDVKGYERIACTNTTIYLDLIDATWSYPTMTFDFACTACTITIIAPRGMTVTTNLRYRNCDVRFPPNVGKEGLPTLCLTGTLEGTNIQVVYF